MYTYRYGGYSESTGDSWEIFSRNGRVVAITKTEDMARRATKGLNMERQEQKRLDNFRL